MPQFYSLRKNSTLRLCVDYRGLNNITTRNRYPLPIIPQFLEQLASAGVFTKVDLRGAYNLVRIKPGDEWKTAFRTRYGHYEYIVMPFGLTNAPAIFQHMMNDIFRSYLDRFVVCYLDDLLIYSANQSEHQEHVRLVLEKLREVGLYAKLEKCKFNVSQVEFLGYIVTEKGVRMDPEKVKAVLNWATPISVKGLQSFLGFSNFYRTFIKNYSEIASPLHALTKKDIKFQWNPQAQDAFDRLKLAFTCAPVLMHVDPHLQFVLETDGSDFAIGAVLSQENSIGELHPVAFLSRKLTAAEVNYEIYDKELLAIVAAFEKWRNYLLGAQKPIIIYTDHRNLVYYTKTRKLNRRQARWSLYLSEFDFVINFRPGRLQGKSDALSRKEEYHLKEGEDAVIQQNQVILKPRMLQLNSLLDEPAVSTLFDDIRELLKYDHWVSSIIQHLEENMNNAKVKFLLVDGLLFRKGRLYIPNKDTS